MRKLYFTAFALLSSLLISAAHAEDQACPLKRLASLEMTPTKDGSLLLVPVTVNGVVLHFLVNAFGATSITAQGADKAMLPRKAPPHRPIAILHETRVHEIVDIPILSLGDASGRIDVSQVRTSVDPRPILDATEADGTIGGDVLLAFDIDLDFANHRLNLFSPDHCGHSPVYWAATFTDLDMTPVFRVTSVGSAWEIQSTYLMLDSQKEVFPGALDGETATFVFNTEIDHSRLPVIYHDKTWSTTCLNDDCSKSKSETIPAGYTPTKPHYDELLFGGISIKSPAIDFWTPKYSVDGVSPDLRSQIPQPTYLEIGLGVMRKLHVYVATKDRKFYFTAADAKK